MKVDLGPADAVEDADVVGVEIGRIFHEFRNDVALDDRGRNLPVGIEVDVAHLARERGRGALKLANHDVVARIDAAHLDGLKLGCRDIHEDGEIGEALGIGLHAREVLTQHREARLS